MIIEAQSFLPNLIIEAQSYLPVGKGLYELRNLDGKVIKKKANVCRLKLYCEREGSQPPPPDSPESHPPKQPSPSVSSPVSPPPNKRRKVSKNKVWKPSLDLRCIDKRVVRNGMLNDRHMHAVNQLLQTQFPDIQGLQSTLKSQTEFDSVVVAGGYLPRGTVS